MRDVYKRQGDLRKGGAALGIRSPLGLLNIMPFGMS